MSCVVQKKSKRINTECLISNCQLCDTQDGSCRVCEDRYFLSNNVCLKCSSNCDTCTSSLKCIKCESGYTNKNGKCNSNKTSDKKDYKSIGLIVGIVIVSIVVMLLCTCVIIRYKRNNDKRNYEASGSLSNIRVTYLRNMNMIETNELFENNRREIYQYYNPYTKKKNDVQEIIPITRDNFNMIIKIVAFDDKLKYYGENVCTICLENFIKGNEYRITPCGHLFHYECIFSWIIDADKKKCPNDNFKFG
ncbi:hypothetical protein SteCoe_35444 [Stentor coeruleus]|uniref:RING-type domain-containing protein n=1 Tax=Stentor coeruleus TaxID=5963 RepID=A0A1R2ASA0_9CILI|nr:hypothetical protein SteCoe_35444 [Stentor coeruleus]